MAMPEQPETVLMTIRWDGRPFLRDVKRAEALLSDADRPERADDLRRLTSPETITRKALGEFE
jgi:hypothetical protein